MEPKLNFVHICENAFLSKEDKINIIGDFDIISTKRGKEAAVLFFPFFVVTNFTVPPNKRYSQKIALISLEDETILFSKEIPLEATGNKVGVILRVEAGFPKGGRYKVLVEMDSIKHEVDLLVNETS